MRTKQISVMSDQVDDLFEQYCKERNIKFEVIGCGLFEVKSSQAKRALNGFRKYLADSVCFSL